MEQINLNEVKFYLREPKLLVPTPIILRVNLNGNLIKCKTKYSCLPSDWDLKTNRAKGKKYHSLNNNLDSLKNDANKIINAFKAINNKMPSSEEFRDEFYRKTEIKTASKKQSSIDKMTLKKFIDRFIEETPKRVNKKTGYNVTSGTQRSYKTFQNLFNEFCNYHKREFDFDDIDLNFAQLFKDFSASKGHHLSYLHKQIRTLRNILNKASLIGYNTNLKYRISDFQVTAPETDTIYLSYKELELLENLDLSKKSYLNHARDIFLCLCYTGLRFSDYNKISIKNIDTDNDILTIFRQQKTKRGNKIAFNPKLYRIFDKYSGNTPAAISGEKVNQYIKEVGSLIPCLHEPIIIEKKLIKETKSTILKKYQLISTHTGRRSYATNLYNDGVDIRLIMQATGHTSETSFFKYIRTTPDESAKELSRNYWRKIKPQVKSTASDLPF